MKCQLGGSGFQPHFERNQVLCALSAALCLVFAEPFSIAAPERVPDDQLIAAVQEAQKLQKRKVEPARLLPIAAALGLTPWELYNQLNRIVPKLPNGPINSIAEVKDEVIYRVLYGGKHFSVRDACALLDCSNDTIYSKRSKESASLVDPYRPIYREPFLYLTLDDYKRLEMLRALTNTRGSISQAAPMLGIAKSALARWVKDDAVLNQIIKSPEFWATIGGTERARELNPLWCEETLSD